MKIGNEHPVGLATVLGVLPALAALIVFVVLIIKNGGDVADAQQLTISIIGGASLVGTAALRQWRSVAGGATPAPEPVVPAAPIAVVSDAMPAPDEEIDLGKAA